MQPDYRLIKIKDVPINIIIDKYNESNNLSTTAIYFNKSIECLRQLFINNDIPYLKRQKYTCNNNFFSTDTEKSWYWAGFLAADGSVSENSNRINLTLCQKDHNHLEKFKKHINSTAPIKNDTRIDLRPAFKTKIYYGSNIRISSSKMVEDIKRFNIIPNKSKNYTVPEHIFENDLCRHFIRGLIDGDGWIKKPSIGLCGTKHCVTNIFNFLKNKLNLESGNLIERKDGLVIFNFARINDKIKIINYLYDVCNVYLDRKKIVANQILKTKIHIKISTKVSKDILSKYIHLNNRDIAKIFNISEHSIGRLMKEYDLYPEHNNILLNVISAHQLITDFNELRSNKKIAKKYNVSTPTVHRALTLLNIDYRVKRDLYKDFPTDVVKKLYYELKSIRAISKKYNLNRTHIKKMLAAA